MPGKSKRRFQLFPEKYGFFPVVFLFYFLLPIFNMLSETELWRIILGYSLLAVFIWTYRQLYFTESERTRLILIFIQLGIILILSLWYQAENIFLGFFTANFIGWFGDTKTYKFIYPLFALSLAIPQIIIIFQAEQISDVLYSVPFTLVMIVSPFAIASLNKRMELEKELDNANEKIEQLVKREERLRIARDLHDTLGHTLSLLTLKSQLVGRLIEKQPERALQEVKEMEQTSRAALKQVRELVADMRTMTLKEELMHVEILLQHAGIAFQAEIDPELPNIPPLVDNVLSNCIREAVTNLVKYSQASACRIHVSNTASGLTAVVEDNGIGLSADTPQGSGMKGMQERLGIIGGEVLWSFTSDGQTMDRQDPDPDIDRGSGTAVTMQVPLIQQAIEEVVM